MGYVAAQIVGAIVAALVIMIVAQRKDGYEVAMNGLGQIVYGAAYLGEYTLMSALISKAVATFLFVTVIPGATQSKAPSAMTGLAIGLILTAIHLVGINIIGDSANPARSIGPAPFVGGKAMADLWVSIMAPLAGGAVADLVFAAGFTRAN